ncbi:cell division protein FtsB [Derxia gummosa]|uniref:Cell division protein FtsB n=1 Tax=Derxia gummosa DSM 723 TaxID=1121388 RepID=A0A8B6X486_9BURK|nr:cell division protein FtsB [Derxia gummosa]
MRWIAVALFALLVLIQYPLWLGDGGWAKVWEREDTVTLMQARNAGLRMRNAGLAAEVRDLKDGTAAVEERARLQLGMIRNDEVFVQILDANEPAPVAQSLLPPPPAPGKPNGGKPPAAPARAATPTVKPAAASPAPANRH